MVLPTQKYSLHCSRLTHRLCGTVHCSQFDLENSAYNVGPEKTTLITLDLDLYQRALKIQHSGLNTNWVLRAGALHIAFAALHALGKTMHGSGK